METLFYSEKLILDVFWEKGVRENYHFSLFDLFYRTFQWRKENQENFLVALNLPVNARVIKWGRAYGLLLTETGYNSLLYPMNTPDPSNSPPLALICFKG